MKSVVAVVLVLNLATSWGVPRPFEWFPSIFGDRGLQFQDFDAPFDSGLSAPQSIFSRSGASAMAIADLSALRRHQVAAISPANPDDPNINVNVVRSATRAGPGQSVGVATRSSVSSVNMNGEQKTSRSAETIVNDNGQVTRYAVHS